MEHVRNSETKISRIRYTLEKMVERGHPYAKKMEERGVRPEHINSVKDMQLLPFTTKQDLQEHYPLAAGLMSTENTSFATTRPLELQATQRWSATQPPTLKCGLTALPGVWGSPDWTSGTHFRSPTAMDCSPAVLEPTMAESSVVVLLFQLRAGRRKSRFA